MTLAQRLASAARETLFPADTDGRDRLAFVMLLAFILVAPWLGSARLPASVAGAPAPVGRLLIPAAGFAIGAVTFSSRSSFRSLRPLVLPLSSMLALMLLGVLQLSPLPEPLLGQLAPVNLQIYHETTELLTLYGRPAPLPMVSLAPDETAATVLRLGGYAALGVAAVHLLRTRLRRRAFAWTAIAAGFLQIVAAGLLKAVGATGLLPFPSTSDLGGYLLVLLLVAMGTLWAEVLTNRDRGREAADRGERLAQRITPLGARITACAVLGAGIFYIRSAVSMAAGGAAILLFLLLAGRHPLRLRRTAAAGAFGFATLVLFGSEAQALPLAVAGTAIDRRLAIWQACIDTWHQFPILGSGLGAFRDAFRRIQPRELSGLVDNARSDPLQILVTGGAVGALFAAVACVSLLVLLLRRWKAQRHREESAYALAGIGALVALGLDGLAEFNLGAPAVPATLACVIGMAIAAGDGSPRDQSWTPRKP